MNPETRLVWHPLQGRLKDLRTQCLLDGERPPHWFRTEVRSEGGFPDLWWGWGAAGLIELKHRHAPPSGADTPCAIESITPKQRLYWRQASEAGSSMYVMTRVGLEWFLHEGDWARRWLGLVPVRELRGANALLPPGSPDRMDNAVTLLPDARSILLLCGARP